MAAIWHEAMAWKKGQEMGSAIMALLQSGKLPLTSSLKIWADNFTGQNKNYALYTTLYGTMRWRLVMMVLGRNGTIWKIV